MDGNHFEISAHKRCWSLPNSSNKSINSPYVGSAPAGLYNIIIVIQSQQALSLPDNIYFERLLIQMTW